MTIKEAALVAHILKEEIEDNKNIYSQEMYVNKLQKIVESGVSNASLSDLSMIFSVINNKEREYRSKYLAAKEQYEKAKNEYERFDKELKERDADVLMTKEEIEKYGTLSISLIRAMDYYHDIKGKYEDYKEASEIEF